MKNADVMKVLGVDSPVALKEKFDVYPLPSGQATANGKKYSSVLEALKHTMEQSEFEAYGFNNYTEKAGSVDIKPVSKYAGLLATTALEVPGREIDSIIDVVGSEVVYGHNFFKELATGARDIVGGRSKSIQKTLAESRKQALLELKEEAGAIGADAIIAVQFSYTEMSGGGWSSPLVAATGTAVKLK